SLGDAELLARLVSLVSPALVAPLGNPRQVNLIEQLLRQSNQLAETAQPGSTEPDRSRSKRVVSVRAPR
ncbi:hypothetical protein NYR05_11625, partial [Adlercreutzia mucosicola]